MRIALDGTAWHPDLKMRVASGDPGPRGGLSQDADIPVAKWVGAYVPEAAGDRPGGGPAGRAGLSSGLGVPASAGFVVRRLFHPGRAVDLRQAKAVRVLGVWAPGQEEPGSARPLADLVALDDRRMGLRDTQGGRFGGVPHPPVPGSLHPPLPVDCRRAGRGPGHACKPKGPRLSLLRVGTGPAESG